MRNRGIDDNHILPQRHEDASAAGWVCNRLDWCSIHIDCFRLPPSQTASEPSEPRESSLLSTHTHCLRHDNIGPIRENDRGGTKQNMAGGHGPATP